jgi:LruC domain-containing protein
MGETFVRDFEVDYVKNLVVRIVIRGDITETAAEPDADGDGIPDSLDQFPDDPTRATTVKYPSNGEYYTIAYEDLYPKPGDMDFNDYVVRANFEEDLNAKGEVVRIRAHYVHVARGAGYKHTFHLKVPGAPDMEYHLVRMKANGQVALDESGVVAAGEGLEVLPKSLTTISASNTSARSEQAFNVGWSADVELILTTPVGSDKIVRVPYDSYLYVMNTDKEVHFAGIYGNPDAGWFDTTALETDLYVDENGFPWALIVPGDWHWPYERGDIHKAYEFFDDWYTTSGKDAQDWYLTPTEGKVFNY